MEKGGLRLVLFCFTLSVLVIITSLKSKRIKNVALVQADIRKLPDRVTKTKYDLIVIIDVIEHVSITDATKIIKKLKKNQGG